MNTKITALFGLATVLGIGAMYGVSSRAAAQQPGIVPPAGKMAREKHPELQAALRALRNAKTRLNNASRDYGGHREKAVDLTNQAISEVEAAIAFDKH